MAVFSLVSIDNARYMLLSPIRLHYSNFRAQIRFDEPTYLSGKTWRNGLHKLGHPNIKKEEDGQQGHKWCFSMVLKMTVIT
jgi:hypothetical protein